MTHRQKKTLIAIAFFAIGVLCLFFASCSKKEDTAPNKKTEPEQNQPVMSKSTQTPPTQPAPPPTLDNQLQSGQLGKVHGMGNANELVAVPKALTKKDEWVHKAVYDPLMALIAHAKADGITLSVLSAYRSYDHQKRIWEKKWGDSADNDVNQALKNLEYSSFPGTSRHHWGTDIDFNSVELSYWQSDEGRRVHAWLTKNAPKYGFCQTYGNDRTQGYAVEDWHWSHLPTAMPYYQQISNLAVVQIATSQPVKGAEAVRTLNTKLFGYIQGISPCHDTIMDGKLPAMPTPAPTPKPKVEPKKDTTQSTNTTKEVPIVGGQQGSW